MRILMTTDTIGGVWTVTRELTQQLLDRGHAVALISFGRAPSNEQRAWCKRIAAEHRLRFLFRASDTALEWMQDNVAAFSGGVDLVLRTAEEFGAELVHSHQFCWGALPVDLPCLVTAHSDVMSWSASCCPEGLKNSEWLMRYRALVQKGLDRADAVIAPTRWMQRALCTHFHVPCPFFVIPNGRTVSHKAGAEDRKLQAISVGRLWDQAKGMQTLLEIDSPLPILVAGEDSFGASSTSTGNLESLGFLDERALLDLFRCSSIYIATSIYEPFGLAPVEAAVCGCAVAVRDLPSLREVWADTAFFYDTPEELTCLLSELTHNPEMLRVAQDKARARAEEFTAARMAENYLALYESVRVSTKTASTLSQELVTHAA
jgi:glycosyltransferase involved in cell wall biosynthesis